MLQTLENSLESMCYAANMIEAPLKSQFRENIEAMKIAIKKAKGE